jgi:hypothetical protein
MQDGIYRQRAYDTICAEQPQFYNGKVVGAQQYRDTCKLQQTEKMGGLDRICGRIGRL